MRINAFTTYVCLIALTGGIASAETPLDVSQSAEASFQLGLSLHLEGKEKAAQAPLEKALAAWQTEVPNAFGVVRAAEALASVKRNLADYQGAEILLRQTLPVAPDGNPAARIHCALADLLREEGRRTEGIALFEKASKIEGLNSARQWDILIGLGSLHGETGETESALDEWNKAAEIARAQNEPGMEAIAMRGMGEAWLVAGNFSRAQPLLRRALAGFLNRPAYRMDEASTLADLAQVHIGNNRLALAEEALRSALAIKENVLHAHHPQVAVLLQMLADTLTRRGDFEAGRFQIERARLIMAGNFGEESPMTASLLASWGMMVHRANRYGEAITHYRTALAIFEKNGGEVQSLRVRVMSNYAHALKATNRNKEANALFAQVRSFQGK